jgi:hypothetical protein
LTSFWDACFLAAFGDLSPMFSSPFVGGFPGLHDTASDDEEGECFPAFKCFCLRPVFSLRFQSPKRHTTLRVNPAFHRFDWLLALCCVWLIDDRAAAVALSPSLRSARLPRPSPLWPNRWLFVGSPAEARTASAREVTVMGRLHSTPDVPPEVAIRPFTGAVPAISGGHVMLRDVSGPLVYIREQQLEGLGIVEITRQVLDGSTSSAGWPRPPLRGDPLLALTSRGSPRATTARPAGASDRAAASSWETDGGSGA